MTGSKTSSGSESAAPVSPGFVAQLMILAAMLSGLVQVAAVMVSQHALGVIVSMGPHLMWMIPVANLLLFALPALLLIILVWRRPAEKTRRPVVFVAAFLGFLNLTLSIPRFHQGASIVLAAGLAVVAMRILVPRWGGLVRAVRWTLLPVTALVALLAAGVFGSLRYREWREVRSLGDVRAGAPSILLLVLDTVRSLNVSAYGYPRPTAPIMQKLSERGVLFENALATSSWTLPSHGSLFTGRYAFELTADWTVPLADGYRTLAEELKDRGYLTGGFSGNLAYVTRNFGLHQGFIRFQDYSLSFGEIISSSKLGRDLVNSAWFRRISGFHDFLGRKSAADLTNEFLGWVDSGERRPFFGFINYFDAHEPYLPPEPQASAFASSATVRQNLKMLHMHHRAERLEKNKLTPAEVQREIDAYDAGIAYADAEIGRLLEELDRRGVLANTVVILTSDHGEQFGEHQLFEHGNSLYRPAVAVPLVIAGPGVPRGNRVERPVTLRDIPATILALTGTGQAGFPGTPLPGVWEGTSGGGRLFSSLTLAGGRQLMAVQDGDLYFIRWPGKRQLYNLREDPREEVNLVDRPEMLPVIVSLESSLDSAQQHRLTGP